MNEIKARLGKLRDFQNQRAGEIPPVSSTAFQMRLLLFPIFLQSADWMNAEEKAAVLELNPLDFAEGYSRNTVLEAQEIIRREDTQKGKI